MAIRVRVRVRVKVRVRVRVHINSYYNSYSTHSKAIHPAGDTTPETLRSPILSFKHSTSIYSKRHETNKLRKKTHKLSKEVGYGKPKANAATPKTATIAKQTILPDRPDHDKPIYMGQFQWGPGTQEGSHCHPVTTANKFSTLSTEDDEDMHGDRRDEGAAGRRQRSDASSRWHNTNHGCRTTRGGPTRPTLIPGDDNCTSSTEGTSTV